MPFAALMVSGTARGGKVGYKKKQQCRKTIDIATTPAKSSRISFLWPSHASRECRRPENRVVYEEGLFIRAKLTHSVKGNTPTEVSCIAWAPLTSAPGSFRGPHASSPHATKCSPKDGDFQPPS